MMRFDYLLDCPLLHVSDSAELNGNINGPSLIRVPDWVRQPLGRYYLYFAHHEGDSIRLAYANNLTGPWTLHTAGALQLRDSLFTTVPPQPADLHPIAAESIANGHDGTYPHIASPDVIIDEQAQQIRLYYHGRCADGLQLTRVALSADGLHFTPRTPLLALPYLRMFRHQNAWFGIGMPGILYHSADGLSEFTEGAQILPPKVRHVAVHKQGDTLLIFWTQVGDAPERILLSTLDISAEWATWQLDNTYELHRPQRDWEGAAQPNEPSRYASIMHPVNQLRDPAIFIEDEQLYLLYAIAGEQGIGIGRLTPNANL